MDKRIIILFIFIFLGIGIVSSVIIDTGEPTVRVTVVGSDSNVTTACSGGTYLLGNGSCATAPTGGDPTWDYNQSLSPTITIWLYNQTDAASGTNYNYNQTTATVTMFNFSWATTYNATYNKWAYNQTDILGLNASYGKYWINWTTITNISMFAHYGMFWYNMSDGTGTGNASWNQSYANTLYISSGNTSIYDGLINNASYLSTYNATYNTWAYNMTSEVELDWLYRNSSTISFNSSKLSTTYYNVTQSTAVAGTIVGEISYTWHSDGSYDSATLNITEDSGSPGLDVRMNFTNVSDFNGGVMRYYTSPLAGDYPIIQLWSYTNNDWEDYPSVGESKSYATIEQPVFDNTDHIQDKVVQMRIYKASNGNTNNKYYIDWIAVYKGYGTPVGEEIDPLSFHRNDNLDNTGYNITGNVFFGNISNISGNVYVNNLEVKKWLYNQSDGTGTGNVSWNESYANTLYAGIQWNYNQSIPYDDYNYNMSIPYDNFNYNMSDTLGLNASYGDYWINWTTITNISMFAHYGQFWYNMSDGTGSVFSTNTTAFWNTTVEYVIINGSINLSTGKLLLGNIKVEDYLYNQSTPYDAFNYNLTTMTVNMFNFSWSSTYNATYDIWTYNQTDITGLNTSYNIWWYNMTTAPYNYSTATSNMFNYSWSTTYNATYDAKISSPWITNASGTAFYNNTIAQVGIGTATPDSKLEVVSTGAHAVEDITTYGDGFLSILNLREALGTEASPTATLDGDLIGQIAFQGYNPDNANKFTSGALIRATSTGEWGTGVDTTDSPTKLDFYTSPDGGSIALRMTIDDTGAIGIGTATPTHKLNVVGNFNMTDASGNGIFTNASCIIIKHGNTEGRICS